MKLKRTNREESFAQAQGRLIYDCRTERGITRKQLAEHTGIHSVMLMRIELGDTTASTFVLYLLADALNVPRDTFFPKGVTVPTRTADEARAERFFAMTEGQQCRRAYA
jgi:transcriptional regulator with XRE-family HTH domain